MLEFYKLSQQSCRSSRFGQPIRNPLLFISTQLLSLLKCNVQSGSLHAWETGHSLDSHVDCIGCNQQTAPACTYMMLSFCRVVIVLECFSCTCRYYLKTWNWRQTKQASYTEHTQQLVTKALQGLQCVDKLRLSHGKENFAFASSAHVLYSSNKRCTQSGCRLGPGVSELG